MLNDFLMELRHFIKTLCKQKVKTFFLSTLIAINIKWIPRLNEWRARGSPYSCVPSPNSHSWVKIKKSLKPCSGSMTKNRGMFIDNI